MNKVLKLRIALSMGGRRRRVYTYVEDELADNSDDAEKRLFRAEARAARKLN